MWTHVFLVSLGLCIFTDLTRPCDSPFFFPPSLSRFTLFHLLFLFLLSLSLVAFSLIQIKKTRKCRLDRKEFRFLGHFHENVEKLVWRQIVCWFFHFFFSLKELTSTTEMIFAGRYLHFIHTLDRQEGWMRLFNFSRPSPLSSELSDEETKQVPPIPHWRTL